MSKQHVAICEKVALTIEEAAEYSNIGQNRISSLLKEPRCPFVLYVGTKKLVKRKEFEKFISKSVEILAEDEMKMNIHKDKMLWYNTKYCIRTSDERSWNMGKDLKGKELGLWISTWLSFDMLVNQRFSYWTGIKSKDL